MTPVWGPDLFILHSFSVMQAAAKRFRVTGSGKVVARRAGKNHFNEKMSRDDIRDASKM
jgi:ribosomal protein L35